MASSSSSSVSESAPSCSSSSSSYITPIFASIRSTTASVLSNPACSVSIDTIALDNELSVHADRYDPSVPGNLAPSWDQWYHFADPLDPESTALYVLVIDAINFCFWPRPGYEYFHLTYALKNIIMKDRTAFSPHRLSQIDEETLAGWLQPIKALHEVNDDIINGVKIAASSLNDPIFPSHTVSIPLLKSRVAALRDLGRGLLRSYNGSAVNLIESCHGDAELLVDRITSDFPCFRDSCIYPPTGELIFLYKRAQILIGDLYGAFKGEGLGKFFNINKITCFADYRLPQLLYTLKIMKYTPELEKKILSHELLPSGCKEEIEIRAATIQCVELMIKKLTEKGKKVHAFQLDWILWERAEALLVKLPPHHKTLTSFY